MPSRAHNDTHKVVSVRAPVELAEAFSVMAHDHGRDFSTELRELMEHAVREWALTDNDPRGSAGRVEQNSSGGTRDALSA